MQMADSTGKCSPVFYYNIRCETRLIDWPVVLPDMADVTQGIEEVRTAPCESLPSGGRVFLKLFLHSLAMFTLPFCAYFTCRNYAEKEFGVEPPLSFIYGAVAAVCIIQGVIFSYLYQAFKEERLAKKLLATAKME